MAINFGLLNTQAPAEIGNTIGNALAMRRQRDLQDEQLAQQRQQFQVQNALAGMQLQKAQQESQDQSNFRNALGGLQPGAETASPEMYRASPSLAMAFEKQRFEQRKGKSEMEKSQTETALKRAELADRIAGEVYADPRREKFVWAIQQRAAMGESPETLRYLSEKLNATPDEELPNMAAQYLKATKEGMQAEVARLNPKPATPSDLSRLIAERDALPQGDPRRATYDAAISKSTTHAPGTNVSVNTGQKGLDNEIKLRGDFRSEPTYKAHQEMTSAYGQIKQSLGQASPAGDLAGATKLMKLLDPGSVVRESELGMAMAANGLLDRVTNYATNILNGTKLTPTQRADFQRLADALYAESVKMYNAKGDEYRGIAKDYGLNEGRIAGVPAAAPSSPKRYVETRRTSDGRTLGKLPDGTVEVVQ